MSTLFKGVYYYLAILLTEYNIQGSTLIKEAYYLREYNNSCSTFPNLLWNILLLWSTGGDLNGGYLDLPAGPRSGFMGLGFDSRNCILFRL